MRVTKEKVAENRAALIEAAAKLFAEKGIDGVGVAEISKAAGLTHGALYAQFPSKDALAAEAVAFAVARGNGRMAALSEIVQPGQALAAQLDYYLSERHLENLVGGCAMATSASEAARQSLEVRTCFSEGVRDLVRIFEQELGDSSSALPRHGRALAMVASLVGAVAVARAAAESHPQLSSDVLKAVRMVADELGGDRKPSKGAVRRTRKPARKDG